MKILKNNFVLKFVVTLFLVGLLIGLLTYINFKPDLSSYLSVFKDNLVDTHQNTFLLNIIFISGIFILSLSIIGLPVICFYLFYEGLAVGYTFGTFIVLYGIKGALFYLLYFLLIKGIYLILVIYFSTTSIKFIHRLITSIINKNNESLYNVIKYHFLRYIIILIITILNSCLIYFISGKIINLFAPLIK